MGFFSRCVGMLGLLVLLAVATADAQTNSTPVTQDPSAASDDEDGKFDIVFSEFQEQDEYTNNIIRVIRSAVNMSTGRPLTFLRQGDTKGYLFGDNIIVRFKLTKRIPGKGENTTAELMQLLVDIMNDPLREARLKNINAVQVIIVPAGAKVPRFQVRTKWDLVYTLVILAGGLLMLGFIAVVTWRLVLLFRRQADDRRQADAEKAEAAEEAEAKKGTEGVKKQGKGPTSSLDPEGQDTTRTHATWDMPDEDENQVIKQLQSYREESYATGGILNVPQQHHHQQQQHHQQGGNGSSPPLHVQHPTVSHAKRAQIDRKMDLEFGLPEEHADEKAALVGSNKGVGTPNASIELAPMVDYNQKPREMVRNGGNTSGMTDFERRMALDPDLRLPGAKVGGVGDEDPML